MNRKPEKSKGPDTKQVNTNLKRAASIEGKITDTPIATDKTKTDIATILANDYLEGFSLLIADGKALKLSPKTKNHVFFQLGVKDEDNTLHLRMSGNEGGGLHSKEWVALDAITTLLDSQINKPIKSTFLKPLFQGSSANNCGFMAAVLRHADISLLTQSEQSVFVHRLPDGYDANKTKLMSMAS